jgi:hypothetical protein
MMPVSIYSIFQDAARRAISVSPTQNTERTISPKLSGTAKSREKRRECTSTGVWFSTASHRS